MTTTTTCKPDPAVMVMGVALAIMFPLVVSMFIVAFIPGDVAKIVTSRAMYWVELLLIVIYAGRAERQQLLLWNQANYPAYFYGFWTFALLALVFGGIVLSAIPGVLGWKENSVLVSHWLDIVTHNWWLFLLCTLTPAIAEELLFRGYLVSRLQMLFNNAYLAVCISALLFCNLHFKYFSLRETLFSFLLGLIFGLHYQHFRNIYILIIARFLVNVIIFILFRQHLLNIG